MVFLLKNLRIISNRIRGMTRIVDRAPADYVEGVVCQASEVPENGMKVVDLGSGDDKVLLVKQNGQLCAIGTKCSHYGAPLVNGALGNGRVRCPWHGACFNTKTGDIEDFPGLDSIPSYHVEITSTGGVKVRAKRSDLAAQKRLKQMAVRDPKNESTFVIVGGGAAGQVCLETLRQEGFSGRIVLVTADKFHPYDRVKLSKQLEVTIDKIQLRAESFYKEHDIEVLNDMKVTSLDPKSKCVQLSNGETLNYTSLFIATGCTPARPNMTGVDLANVFTLRSLTNANDIFKALTPDSNVVIFGSSFIGMEAAASCVGKVKSVTVVGRSAVPFEASFGSELGGRIGQLFMDKGIVLKMETTIKGIEGDGKVDSVLLSDGTKLPADVVIIGLGSTFSTDFLESSGIELTAQGAVPVSKFLETSVPGVFAGGDIAKAPVFAFNDTPQTIGHWGLAHYHGRIAALNMMSIATPLKTVPFFWTMLFGTSFRYAGYIDKADDIVTSGDLEGLKYVCYYCKGDKVTAVATVGVDPLAAQFAELVYNGGTLSKKRVQEEPLTWNKS